MSDAKTVFHHILDGTLPSTVVFEDANVLAINDIHPKAPLHLLFIPKLAHAVASIIDCHGNKAHVPGMLIEAARQFATQQGIDGYKLQFNVGPKGGQEVMYLHLHFLSDQALGQ